MRYLTGTQTLTLINSANGSGILKWWVDAYFSVRPNMRVSTEEDYLWDMGFPLQVPTNRSSLVEGLRKLR